MCGGCRILGDMRDLVPYDRCQSAFDRLRLMDGRNGSPRTDEIIGGGDEENGEMRRKKITLLFRRKGLREQRPRAPQVHGGTR